MPFFSLIVPVFNSAKFVGACIESVLSQSFTDFEVILVDDGSTDKSYEICMKYQDSRIILLQKENGGVSSARNFGISRALGDYIWFVDSDDLISNNSLEIIYGTIVKETADIFTFGFRTIEKGSPDCYSSDLIESTAVFSGIEYLNINQQIYLPPWRMVFKRSFLEQHGLHFPSGIIIGEDFYFNLHAFRYAKKVKRIEGFLYSYMKRENSITTSRPGRANIDSQLRILSMLKTMSVENVYDKDYLANRMKKNMYFILLNLWYRDPSAGRLQPYFRHIRELGFIIPLQVTDSWTDRTIIKAFNSNPWKAYMIFSMNYLFSRLRQKFKL